MEHELLNENQIFEQIDNLNKYFLLYQKDKNSFTKSVIYEEKLVETVEKIIIEKEFETK